MCLVTCLSVLNNYNYIADSIKVALALVRPSQGKFQQETFSKISDRT